MVFSAMAAMTVSLACDSGGYQRVSLSSRQDGVTQQSPGQSPLRLGMAPILSARSGGEALAALCGELSRRLNRPVSPLLGTDYAEINDMLSLGQLDVGIVCTGAFADPKLQQFCKVLLVPQLPPEGSYYRSLIVVRAGDPANRFGDLRGRSAVFTDSLSLTGYLYPLSRLCAMGKKPSDFFLALSFSHSHDRSIAMVADGLADAAAVDSAVFRDWLERNKTHSRQLRVLERSEPFPSPPIVVRDALTPAEKDLLRTAFLNLMATAAGQAILKQMGWSGLKDPDSEYLNRLQATGAFMKGLHDQNCLSP